MTFTDAELIALLTEALESVDEPQDEPGTITSSDVMDLLGVNRYRAVQALSVLSEAGHVKKAMVRRSNEWGVARRVPGYRIVAVAD